MISEEFYRCSNLRIIGTAAAYRLPINGAHIILASDSHLYDFTELIGFSLIFKTTHLGLQPDRGLVQLPKRFWNMILRGSPNLERLCIDTFQARRIDLTPLLDGQWPNLRSLTLGVFNLYSAASPRSLQGFLASHRSLSHLSLHDKTEELSPWRYNMPHASLGHIKTFVVGVEFAMVNPYAFFDATEVRLGSIPLYMERGWDGVESMRCLASLRVLVGDSKDLRSLLFNCAPLSHLHIDGLEFMKNAKQMNHLMNALRSPNLTSLKTLTLGFMANWPPQPGKYQMLLQASQVFRALPQMTSLTLKCIRYLPHAPDQLFERGIFESSWLHDSVVVRVISYITPEFTAKRYTVPLGHLLKNRLSQSGSRG